jgi:hypothetical protein
MAIKNISDSAANSLDRSSSAIAAGRAFGLPLETIKTAIHPVLYLVLFLAYAVLRITNFDALQEVRSFPDTPVYTKLASRSFFDLIFWGGPRPWTTPLVFKLLGNDPPSIAVFQLTFSIVSWGLLALCVARAVQFFWLKAVAFGFILLFSLSAEVAMWDGVLLPDSISLSFMALLIAGWLWVLESWRWYKAALIVLVALFWSFIQDTNAWVVLMVAGGLMIGVAAGRIQRRYVLMAMAFAIVFAANDYSANRARRWVVAFMNNVGLRILPISERTEYFAQAGMPVTPALMGRAGKKAWSDNWTFFKDPELEEFRQWLYTRGKLTYVRFLLSHPAMTIQEPLRQPELLLSAELRNYAPAGFAPIIDGALAEIVYVKKWALLCIWAAAIAFGLALGLRIWRDYPPFVVPLALILLAYPHGVLVWHADPNEIARHAFRAGVHFRLGLWLLVLFAADLIIAQIRNARSSLVPARKRLT